MIDRGRAGDGEHTGAHDARVLFIDDDAVVAAMYKARLEREGYVVDVAADGLIGITMALASPPDLIYLDLRLPHDMDGFQVLARLRDDPKLARIPVAILTQYSEPLLRQCGFQMGAIAFIVKTETPPSVLAKETADWARLRPPPLSHEQRRSPIA